ncbi:hypothetical protein Tco_0867169 [Tanacetum coccineum]
MNPQETQQVAARDEKWVPFTERVKISSTNVRLETTVPHLDICPIVEGVNFIDVPDDDTTLAFLIKMGYKGQLYKHPNMFVDHMHHPWRTLVAIINKCLSGKTASNDKLYLAYQIDHRKEKRSRCENIPFPRFTKVIINHFLTQHKSLSNLKYQHYHTIKDDGIVCRLKFVRIGEDYQEYGLSIPETMLTEAIKQSESYQMFIKYYIGQIPLKKIRGKGSQRKKTADDSQETVNVSEESKPKPESVKRKNSSKRRIKKKVTLSADDNIISDDPDTALDKRHPGTGGSNEGTGTIPGVPNESTIISATSSEGTGTKPRVLDKEKDITKENVILEWGSEQESEYSEEDKLDDEEKDDDEDDETVSDEDDIYKYKIYVRKDEDEEMLNAEVDNFDKGDEEVTDATKADAKKTSEVKDDAKKTKLPPSSSSLSISLCFEIDSLLEVKIQSKVPQIQSTSILSVPVFVISEPPVLTPVQESPLITTITTLPPSSVSTTPSVPKQTTTRGEELKIQTKEPVEEPIAEVVMDDMCDDVFIQSLRPPTPDPDWNKRQVILVQPEQPWFNQTVSATEDPLTFNDLMATPIDFYKYVLNRLKIYNLTQDILLGSAYNLLKGTCSSNIELEYHFQECFKALTDRKEWNNPKGDHYPFDLSKPLPLQGHLGHLTIAADYFFKNDLEYLKSFDPERKYTTSITKTKAARYEIVGIEDMVPTLWSPTKHNVYSTRKILGVKSVSVKKLHGYGHLEEIMVKPADCQLYKFKEGDFVDLHLNDIEDMLLLAKKLNITPPQQTIPEIEFKELYTPSHKPPGVIYKDLTKQKRVMRANELYKFSNGTLKKVRDKLHHRVCDFCLEYNNEMPMRKWTAIDRKMSELIVEQINKQMRERRIIRNLERLVGSRELEMDYKLMTHTI